MKKHHFNKAILMSILVFAVCIFGFVHASVAAVGDITTVAGTGQLGFSGDGGPATQAQLQNPSGVFVDASGNLFIADTSNSRIRKVDGGTGVITTVAGTGQQGFSGDGGPATQAQMNDPRGVFVDASGNLFIADTSNHRIRKVEGIAAPTTLGGVAAPPPAPEDTTPPTITSTSPKDGHQDIDPDTVNQSGIVIAFSEAIDTAKIQIEVKAGEQALTWQPGWSDDDKTLTLTPAAGNELSFEMEYTVTLSQVTDAAGNAAENVMITFTTKSGALLNPDTGSYYETITVPEKITWVDAKVAAEARSFKGIQGHLATITSQTENDFIAENFPEALNRYWIGGFQPPGSPEPRGNWQWVTGEPFDFTNWAGGEPNNAGGTEDAILLWPDGVWNDSLGSNLQSGYIVEYDTQEIITPVAWSFPLSLKKGLNMISLPLKPDTPLTAKGFAENLGATVVIRYDTEQSKFVAYLPEAASGQEGFSIEGGGGYIVNVLEDKEVTFVGQGWGEPVTAAAPPVTVSAEGGWAFVVSGFLDGGENVPSRSDDFSRAYLVVKNLRSGVTAMVNSSPSGEFQAIFVDLTHPPVVHVGDTLEVVALDSNGKRISGPFRWKAQPHHLQYAYLQTRMRLGDVIPDRTRLLANYPNPFNPETWIPYELAEAVEVMLDIYDLSGRLVRRLHVGHKNAGVYVDRPRAIYWDGRNAAGERVGSGMYFYHFRAGQYEAVRKMAILK